MCAAEQKSDVLGITREEEEGKTCRALLQVRVFHGTAVVPLQFAICY